MRAAGYGCTLRFVPAGHMARAHAVIAVSTFSMRPSHGMVGPRPVVDVAVCRAE